MNEEKQSEEKETTKVEWQAMEHPHYKKEAGWYWVIGGGAVILLMVALWQKNFFFGIFIVLAATTMMSLGNRHPKVVDFRIEEDGVSVAGNKYVYKNIEGFAIVREEHRLSEIILKKKGPVNPFLRLPIDNKSLDKAEAELKEHLPEIHYEKTFIDAISDLLGF